MRDKAAYHSLFREVCGANKSNQGTQMSNSAQTVAKNVEGDEMCVSIVGMCACMLCIVCIYVCMHL